MRERVIWLLWLVWAWFHVVGLAGGPGGIVLRANGGELAEESTY